jgi:hypothetical protein
MAKAPDTFDTQETPREPIVDDAEVERLDPWDDGPPSKAQHGWNHTRRPAKTDADRGHGRKSRAANRERMKGSRQHNP